MIVLSIAKLSNLQTAGTNINIPKFVKYLNKICVSGYLDLGTEDLINLKGFNNYFKIKDLSELSIKELPSPFNKPDIVVFQGFYRPEFIKISKQLKKLNIPYTIVPRCSLTYEAQNIKPLKKRVGNLLFFNKMVKDAKFIHFLTENEYIESKKAFKFRNHVIVGNGIELPKKIYKVKDRSEFKVVFIGRYSIYHKGLDILVRAINLGQGYFREKHIKFILYGYNSDNGLEFLQNFVEKNNLRDLIELNDAVLGEEKQRTLLDTDVFIHTSRLEGHPTSVIEAISYGIPVIVTPGTNVVDEVEKNELGFTTELNERSIFDCIKNAYENKDKFDIISRNEIEYSKNNFDWDEIANKIIKEYTKVLSKENK